MAKGFKTCKACGLAVGPRSIKCKGCGEAFKQRGNQENKTIPQPVEPVFSDGIISEAKMVLGRGRKSCDSCGHITGPRSKDCPKCHTKFMFKPKSKEATETRIEKSVKWRDLVRGDVVRISKGPYWEDGEGNRIGMGHKGRFKVIRQIDDNGFLAFANSGGFAYIYMGPKKPNERISDKYMLRPHRILRMRKKEKTSD